MKLTNKLESMAKRESSEGILARYLLDTGKHNELKVTEICEECHISPPTLYRVVKKLGFDSFSEFKYQYKNELLDINNKKNVLLNMEKDELVNFYSNELKSSITNINGFLDNDKITTVTQKIKNANKVILIARGDAQVCAQYFQNKLLKLNINAYVPRGSHEQQFFIDNASNDTVIILIENKSSIESFDNLIKNVTKSGAFSIIFSDQEHEETNSSLVFDVLAKSYETEMITKFAILFIFDFIYLELVNDDRNNFIKRFTNFELWN